MPTNIENELASFHKFLTERLKEDEVDLSPEEALDLWRSEHPTLREQSETVMALREALNDMDRGDRGISFEQFDREFQQRKATTPENGRK